MTRTVRMIIFAAAALGLAVLFGAAIARMPAFGAAHHPYRDLAAAASLARGAPNVISSVNFDQRGFDTLGEEMILVGSVLGAVALLRPAHHERDRTAPISRPYGGRVLPATQFAGYALLPATLAIGADVVAHGHLTPGGGFQGGVILATGLHMAYVAGDYAALRRLRPVRWYAYGEALGAGAFMALGLAGPAVSGAYMTNFLPPGAFRSLISAGTVPLFNLATGCAVACGMVVLLAAFLRQELLIARTTSEAEEEP